MASKNKKNKGVNSYLSNLGLRLTGTCKRIYFYTKRDRREANKPIREYEKEGREEE